MPLCVSSLATMRCQSSDPSARSPRDGSGSRTSPRHLSIAAESARTENAKRRHVATIRLYAAASVFAHSKAPGSAACTIAYASAQK